MRFHHIALLLVLLLVAAQLGWYAPRLPDRIAASFGADGAPGGYDTKTEFLAWYALSLALIAGVFLALPGLLCRLPPRYVNLPHADHWLAPERRGRTLAELGEALGWFGVCTLLFVAWAFHLSILANLREPVRLAAGPFWAGLALYLSYLVWWMVRLMKRFGRRGRY